MSNFTPYEIMYLLHVHCITEPYKDSHARRDADERFIREGLAVTNDRINNPNTITLTDKGKALVKMLTNTPMPKQVFLDPRDNHVVSDDAIRMRPGFRSMTAALDEMERFSRRHRND